MMCLIDLENGEIKGFIMGSNTHEIRQKFQSLYNYHDDYRRSQCINNLYRIEFPKSGKTNLEGGYILLVE